MIDCIADEGWISGWVMMPFVCFSFWNVSSFQKEGPFVINCTVWVYSQVFIKNSNKALRLMW